MDTLVHSVLSFKIRDALCLEVYSICACHVVHLIGGALYSDCPLWRLYCMALAKGDVRSRPAHHSVSHVI